MSYTAGFACFVAIALLYSAWRDWFGPGFWLKLGGWGLLVVSSILWINAVGWELGITYFFITMPVIAWLAISLNVEVRQRKPSKFYFQQVALPSSHLVKRNALIFVVSLPVAGCASALIVLSLGTYIPSSAFTKMAIQVLGVPTLWGMCMFWCCVDPKLVRPTTIITFTGMVAGITLFQ